MEIHQKNNNMSKGVQLYKIADSSNNQQNIKIVKASPVKNENKGLIFFFASYCYNHHSFRVDLILIKILK